MLDYIVTERRVVSAHAVEFERCHTVIRSKQRLFARRESALAERMSNVTTHPCTRSGHVLRSGP